jgi:transcriptional regulator with XRE-family HTH domain
VTPVQVALEHLQQQVIRRLTLSGVTAKQLSEALGQSEQSWRYKLNGSRRLTLEDLLALVIAVDHTVADLPPLRPDSVRDLIPPVYWDWLTHTELDQGMPQFERPDRWLRVAKTLDDWWGVETVAGRQWAITRDVATHQLLNVTARTGLPSSEAAVEEDEGQVAVEWISEDIRVCLHWTGRDVARDRLAPDEARAEVGRAADRLWKQANSATETTVLAVAAPRAVRDNLRVGLLRDVASTDPDTWHNVGLTEQHRLGLTIDQPDISIRQLHRSRHAPIDWYAVK